ncbi:MAG: hypothetical protein GXO90_02050, partial [FCB group bacterium]|nr:hypothetical protein [FCB group bacterium]
TQNPFDQYVSQERPLYFDYYKEIAFGNNFSDWAELLLFLKTNEIKDLKPSPSLSLFHKYKDNQSSERVFNEIKRHID